MSSIGIITINQEADNPLGRHLWDVPLSMITESYLRVGGLSCLYSITPVWLESDAVTRRPIKLLTSQRPAYHRRADNALLGVHVLQTHPPHTHSSALQSHSLGALAYLGWHRFYHYCLHCPFHFHSE